jgi:hypothetical protein
MAVIEGGMGWCVGRGIDRVSRESVYNEDEMLVYSLNPIQQISEIDME